MPTGNELFDMSAGMGKELFLGKKDAKKAAEKVVPFGKQPRRGTKVTLEERKAEWDRLGKQGYLETYGEGHAVPR